MTATPGWYRVDEKWLRYWDGSEWTDHTRRAASTDGPMPGSPDSLPPVGARFAEGVRRIGRLLASDLAVNWLSYLGVLLMVGGLFGFIVFSFAQVPVAARPVAEGAMPALLLGAAAFLRARGAQVAGSAVALAAGALLPVVLVASLVDNALLPPDLHGTALVLTSAGVCGLVAAGYAAWSARKPSPLRFLVGPALWMAAALLGHLPAHTAPRGQGIAVIGVPHAALMLTAVAVSVLVARLMPTSGLSRATVLAAVPGGAIATICAVVAASRDGAGPGWLALSFAAASAAFAGTALGASGWRRPLGQWGSAAFGVLALSEMARLASWTPERMAAAVLATAGVVAAAAALAVRLRRRVDWLAPWVLAPVGAAFVLLDVAGRGDMHPRPDTAALAVALAGVAVATALLATPLGYPWLRRATASLTVIAGTLAAVAAALTAAQLAYAAAAVAAAAAVLAVTLVVTGRGRAWSQPAADAAVGALIIATGATIGGALSWTALLWSAAAVAAAAGVVDRRNWLVASSPLLAALGWWELADSAGLSAREWYAVPAGVAVLTATAVVRTGRSRAGQPTTTGGLIAAEYAGYALAAGFALLDIVLVGAVNATVAAAAGALIGTWGLLSQVRRRLVAGAVIVLAAVLGEAAVLVTGLWPALHGPLAWLALATGGALVLAAAAGLERARGQLQAIGGRWAEFVDGWE